MGSYGSVKHYERIKFYIGKTISSVKYVRWSVKKKTKKKKKKKKKPNLVIEQSSSLCFASLALGLPPCPLYQ